MNPDNLRDNTPALFLKMSKEMRTIEKCWKGVVLKITRRTEKAWFQFRLDGTADPPAAYVGSPDGWYAESDSSATV